MPETLREAIAGIRADVRHCREGIDRINGDIAQQRRDLDEHKTAANDEHGRLWSAISRLRVRNVAALLGALTMLAAAAVAWAFGRHQ